MKMKPGVFDRLKAAIEPFDTEVRRQRYRDLDFKNAHAVKDLDKRYRWDLLWVAVDNKEVGYIVFDGLSDAHMDTALRKIVRPLGE